MLVAPDLMQFSLCSEQLIASAPAHNDRGDMTETTMPGIDGTDSSYLRELVAADGYLGEQVIYCYHDGGFFRSLDQGSCFELLSGDLPKVAPSELVVVKVDPFNPNDIWVSLGSHGLFNSNDGGWSFCQIGQSTYCYLLAVRSAGSPGDYEIFVSSELSSECGGLYVSSDRGRLWH